MKNPLPTTEVWDDQGLLRVQVRGVVGRPALGDILRTTEAAWALTTAAAGVADYRSALMNLNARDLIVGAQPAMPTGSLVRRPVALLVGRDALAAMCAYCDLQGRCGVLRAAFTEEGAALRWAAEHAALYEAQARFRGLA